MNSFDTLLNAMKNGKIVNLPLSIIELSSEYRKANEDFVEELSHDLRDTDGVMSNILVTADPEHKRFIVCEGIQRVAAARIANLDTIPAKLILSSNPHLAVLRNKLLQLKHNPMELADICHKVIAAGATQTELAQKFVIAKSIVSELIKFTSLPEVIQKAAREDPKRFNHYTLRVLANLSDEEQQARFDSILRGEKKPHERFSAIRNQLTDDKLAKKKLSPEDIASLRHIAERIKQILNDPQYHLATETEQSELTSSEDSEFSSSMSIIPITEEELLQDSLNA